MKVSCHDNKKDDTTVQFESFLSKSQANRQLNTKISMTRFHIKVIKSVLSPIMSLLLFTHYVNYFSMYLQNDHYYVKAYNEMKIKQHGSVIDKELNRYKEEYK